MTTASRASARRGAVLGPLVATVVVGLALVATAGALAGTPGVAGAVTGIALVTAVFAFGGAAVGLVASVAPAASLLVALLTYTLQVVLVGLFYVVLASSGLLDGPLHRGWLSGAVIAGTLAWTATQVWVTSRSRIPAYDLPGPGTEASLR